MIFEVDTLYRMSVRIFFFLEKTEEPFDMSTGDTFSRNNISYIDVQLKGVYVYFKNGAIKGFKFKKMTYEKTFCDAKILIKFELSERHFRKAKEIFRYK